MNIVKDFCMFCYLSFRNTEIYISSMNRWTCSKASSFPGVTLCLQVEWTYPQAMSRLSLWGWGGLISPVWGRMTNCLGVNPNMRGAGLSSLGVF